MGKGGNCDGVRFHSKELESVCPGFYSGVNGAQYFCLSEFLLAHHLPLTMDFIRVVLDDVMQEFPGITVFEFAD
jgi:hypothetical protein